MSANDQRPFPTSAGILFGLGLGGFFDGIVMHQVLQWHHMVTSAGYPPDTVENLQLNTLLDGLFHAVTYVFVVIGLLLLWRTAHRKHLWWSGRMLAGSMLIGFGIFNLVEGLVDHQIFRHSPRQRDGSSRDMDMVGHRFPALGCRHAGRWMASLQVWQAHHRGKLAHTALP